LYAGYLLQSKGIDYEILEASGHVGRRLGKVEGFTDYQIDLGVQWLHGKNSIVGKLIKKTNTKIAKDNTEINYWFENRIMDELPKNIATIFDNNNLPDISYEDYARQMGFGNNYQYIVEAIAAGYGADASELSAYWNAKEAEEWSSGNKDYKFRKSYFDLFNDHIIPEAISKTKLNTIINKIDYQTNKIKVNDNLNQIYESDKVIVTVPITILKDGDIKFNPALPVEKTKAFEKIGMGPGMKVFLKFKSKFYHENTIGGRICSAYVDDSIGKIVKDNIMQAFIMGKQAAFLTSLGDDTSIVNALLKELDIMYGGKATSLFMDAHIQDWTTQPFIRGAYSFSTVDMGDARRIASQTIDNKLYFAGEAMHTGGEHQTVQGAVETGY
jgi:monoamine oxidase